MTAEIDFKQFRDLFPLFGKIVERQVLRVQALRKLKERSQSEDEAEQLRKVKAREVLSSLVKLEEWR